MPQKQGSGRSEEAETGYKDCIVPIKVSGPMCRAIEHPDCQPTRRQLPASQLALASHAVFLALLLPTFLGSFFSRLSFMDLHTCIF